MAVLLVAEHDNRTLNGATAKALTAAVALGSPVHILVAGSGCEAVAQKAAALSGVEKVLLAEADHLKARLAEDMTALIVPLMERYSALVAVSSAAGKDFAPRVAALLDVAQLSDVTAVRSPVQFERPIYAGNAVQTVECNQSRKVLTVRTTAFAATAEGGAAAIERISGRGGKRRYPIRERRAVEIGTARADRCESCDFRRTRHAIRRKFQDARTHC